MGKGKNKTEDVVVGDIVTNEPVVLTPKLMEIPNIEEDIDLKYGECIVKIVSGPDNDKTFKTTLGTVKKYYSNEDVYQIVKKN